MSPYYQDDYCTIYHGDCLELLPGIEADCVVTDPPYGFHKAVWDETFSLDWAEAAAQCAPVMALMPGVWNLPSCPRHIGRLEYRWTLVGYLTNGMTRGCIGFGNWIPCLMYSAEGVSLFVQDGDIKRFAVGTSDKPNHPSPKPLDFMEWVVSRTPGHTVLDPFMGSGTTLVAAKQLGRKAIGIEIEERYCEIAVQRLQQDVLPLFEPEAEAKQIAMR